MPKRSGLPKYVTEFKDRHGKWRLRFRRKGFATHHFKARPGTESFREEYAACIGGKPAPKAVRTSEKTKPGSMSALIALYYGTPEYAALRPASKATYRGILERFRRDFGTYEVVALRRQHVRALLASMADRPAAANNLLDRLKALMTLAVDEGWRDDDPCHKVKPYTIKGDGFHTWTEEEIGQFEAHHAPGSRERLAMALLLYTGQRRSDVVRMGWQHVSGNRIRVVQQKTGVALEVPMHQQLASALAGTPRDRMTFLLTTHGRPYSAAGFGNWFREVCDKAGLPECSAHGLRKAAARRLAEAGCSNQQIKAITGHRTDKEVSRYTAAADQRRLSDQAIEALGGANGERKNGYPANGLAKTGG